MVDVQTALGQFIAESFGARLGNRELSNTESLLDTGVVDSVGVFELVSFMQLTFNIEIEDIEIIPEHFNTIESLASFVRSKQQGGNQGA